MHNALDFEAVSEPEYWLRLVLDQPHDDEQDLTDKQRRRLRDLKDDFWKGERSALLDAIMFCAMNKLSMPWWVSFAFTALVVNTRGGKYKSWDEAFGSAHPKGAHLNKRRRDNQLMGLVYAEVCRVRSEEPKTAIDDQLFGQVGERLQIGKTLCSEMYYRAKRKFGKDPFFWESGMTMTLRMGEIEL